MKQYFFGILTGIVLVSLVGFMLFDNFKTKLVVNNIAQVQNQIIKALQQPPQQPMVVDSQKGK